MRFCIPLSLVKIMEEKKNRGERNFFSYGKRVMKIKWILLIALVWLGGCYLIGQYRYPDKGRQFIHTEPVQDQVEHIQDQPIQQENEKQLTWSEFDLVFEGNEQPTDNPWGYVAGVIDTDFAGECILLNPNTAVTVTLPENLSSLKLSFVIHPWVVESSDGAGMVVQFFDSKGDVFEEQVINIEARVEWQNYSFDLYEMDVVSIKMNCNNGMNNDDSADWVIISVG